MVPVYFSVSSLCLIPQPPRTNTARARRAESESKDSAVLVTPTGFEPVSPGWNLSGRRGVSGTSAISGAYGSVGSA